MNIRRLAYFFFAMVAFYAALGGAYGIGVWARVPIGAVVIVAYFLGYRLGREDGATK